MIGTGTMVGWHVEQGLSYEGCEEQYAKRVRSSQETKRAKQGRREDWHFEIEILKFACYFEIPALCLKREARRRASDHSKFEESTSPVPTKIDASPPVSDVDAMSSFCQVCG